MATNITAKIQMRQDTAANWASKNPVLAAGEIGYDTTNKQTKIGDGTTAWAGLKAFTVGVETDNPQGYDLVIKTQTKFEALIASSTWFDATSVAFVGQFTLSTTNNGGIKIPATVKQIHGFKSAKITITNFKHNSDTAKGGLWYETLPTTNDYSIRDLEVSCTGVNDYGFGFYNCNNLSNCTGTGTGTTNGRGFFYCNNLLNCIGTGTGATYSEGFRDCFNLSNCTGTGTGTNGRGFYNCNNLSNCTGTGTGTGADGYGFYKCNNLSNCTGTGTGTGADGYGFYRIECATNCNDGGSSTKMWDGTNKNINVETCRKTHINANNGTLNA